MSRYFTFNLSSYSLLITKHKGGGCVEIYPELCTCMPIIGKRETKFNLMKKLANKTKRKKFYY
jgi:hypothetical protein